MAEYQVFARRYRPQRFCDVVGQPAIVTTLQNAIKHKRSAHAYLFCGPRGTGKTTLARLFAKALNCLQPSSSCEPCNSCPSCQEITSGCSLDLLEIDGASNRGIEEIRQIRDTVAYTASKGHYRIYIIDEVHMLTKEAFNALLKTLEEPPSTVKFLFATTEPHKVPSTILSRCQRFDLKRIPDELIIQKLQFIAHDLNLQAEEEALRMIAARAEGGLRDAESLFDQMISFHGEEVTAEAVSSVLGMMPIEVFFKLDEAGKEGNLAFAFDVAHRLFAEGKDLGYFLDSLISHFRTLLFCKLVRQGPIVPPLIASLQQRYETSAKLYSQEQCLTILDLLVDAQGQIKLASSPLIAIEALLLRIMRTHQRIPIEFLVRRLVELEKAVTAPSTTLQMPVAMQSPCLSSNAPIQAAEQAPLPPPPPSPLTIRRMTVDPSPSPADLGNKSATPRSLSHPPTSKEELLKQQSRIDTLLHFAAVELGGSLEKKHDIMPKK